jgi:hypothetical protein
MKLKSLTILILLAISTFLFATDPWGDPVILSGSMTVMAQVNINDAPAVAGDVLAAFVSVGGNPQLRGKGPVMVIDGIPGCLLQVYTESTGEQITFKVWDESAAIVCDATQSLPSEVNGTVGSYPNNMYQITAYSSTQVLDPWGNPEILTGSMTVMAQVLINNSPATADDVLAAFVTVGGTEQLRGKAQIQVIDGVPGCLLQVFTETPGEVITFKIWDFSEQQIVTDSNTLLSVVDGTVGSYPNDFYVINAGGTTQQVAIPAFSVPEGVYTTAQNVAITCTTAGAQIRYTTNGNDPTETSALYSTPITMPLNSVTTLKAKAFLSGWLPSPISSATYAITGTVATPSFSVPAGTYTSPQTVSISCSTPGAQIRFTTNGSEPTAASALYSAPLTVSETTTLKAKAFLLNWATSATATAVYTITGTVATPAFSPPGGTYTSAQTVSIACATAGAQIRYTTNGTEPTATSTLYSAPISVNATTTLKAKAFLTSWNPSPTATAAYVITGTVATPAFSPEGGTYTSAQTVTIACATPGAQIRYTTNGSEPTATSTLYSAPIPVNATTTLKAKAFLTSWNPSLTATAAYIITGTVANPTFNPAGGEYEEAINVQINCATPGAQIYYTLDGAEPTQSSTMYTVPIPLEEDTTVKACAFLTDWLPSQIVEAFYDFPTSIPDGPSAPVISGIQGAYPNPFKDNLTVVLGIKDGHQDYQFKIYNIRGECVHSGSGFAKGTFELNWDGRASNGSKLPSGVYLLKFSSKEIQHTRRVIMY